MKIKPEQIERIASQLVANYHDQDLIVAKAADGTLKAKIIEVIAKNFAEEEAIAPVIAIAFSGSSQI